jgi:hypothetical protein
MATRRAPVPNSTPKRSRGRPPKPRPIYSLATQPPPPPLGRPPKYDSKAILALVDAHRKAAAAQGHQLRRGSALCELLAEAIRTREPKKYQTFKTARDDYEGSHSRRAALRLALERVARKHLQTLERLLSYAVKGRPKRK